MAQVSHAVRRGEQDVQGGTLKRGAERRAQGPDPRLRPATPTMSPGV